MLERRCVYLRCLAYRIHEDYDDATLKWWQGNFREINGLCKNCFLPSVRRPRVSGISRTYADGASSKYVRLSLVPRPSSLSTSLMRSSSLAVSKSSPLLIILTNLCTLYLQDNNTAWRTVSNNREKLGSGNYTRWLGHERSRLGASTCAHSFCIPANL